MISTKWQCPSNIALIKYWGKRKGKQIPANASISFTLSNALTTTEIIANKKLESGIQFQLFFQGKRKESFEPKIAKFFSDILEEYTWLNDYELIINTENTFPHSSGIASSASGMGALALCICSLHENITGSKIVDFYQKASYLARIGSGSACRSMIDGFALWGKLPEIEQSSDLYAITLPIKLHSNFGKLYDTVIIVEEGAKSVSSTAGHSLLNNHPFASERFELANKRCNLLIKAMENGDVQSFIHLVEAEALMLHSMMMTSETPFILMKPNTLQIIQKILKFREETKYEIMFTLDAGANVHIIYTSKNIDEIRAFINEELLQFAQSRMCLHNEMGALAINY